MNTTIHQLTFSSESALTLSAIEQTKRCLSFFLTISPPADYTVIDKYKPEIKDIFIDGLWLSLEVPAPEQTFIRAVCPGKVTYDRASASLNFKPSIQISANGHEYVSAFVITGVEDLH
ncbi:MAG: hypothetical protein IPG76_00120 [Acidobacteria bacterium]|nr:hypothetical protein [Acidobacteriota bacterium]